ncbi:alpha-L-fucosidase [Vagococcus zengguangii]|uniref:alpha-L-fucosidase n=1 Tax=Vagococcus zengguangii TaxID=2571750 RepID=A0A4D7CV54_9ENTE|nr:alpha-L-fucosidase [Vagococcus zengguangii]QCI86181.1 alpha-L-fucosidase [Vagococcus zengguangii]
MTTYYNWPDNFPSTEWFEHDRFGLFIHFGLFSVGARHEWYMTTEQIEKDDYKKYFDYFNPDLFDADEWAKQAYETGVKYVVFTTKHHEGFALWDSQYTDYKITNTEFKRDLLAELLPALRKYGLKIGLYHSVIDWHHPDFIVDGLHPARDNLVEREKNSERKMANYQQYLRNQVTELLSNYGKIDYMWFDFSYPHRDWGWSKGKGKNDWDSEKLEQLCFDLQPHLIINDRLNLDRGVITPEQYQPQEPLTQDGMPVLWEACQTMYGTWGYDRDNYEWKSKELLLKMMIDTVSKNGNYLMNIGPTARGIITNETKEVLHYFKEWMTYHSRSIIGCGASYFVDPIDCRYTQNGNRLYLHVYSWPYTHIHLKGLAGKVDYVQFLHDASEIKFRTFDPEEVITSTETKISPDDIVLLLPTVKPTTFDVPVIEIFLKA